VAVTNSAASSTLANALPSITWRQFRVSDKSLEGHPCPVGFLAIPPFLPLPFLHPVPDSEVTGPFFGIVPRPSH